jgi:hypothetical protein
MGARTSMAGTCAPAEGVIHTGYGALDPQRANLGRRVRALPSVVKRQNAYAPHVTNYFASVESLPSTTPGSEL